MNECYPSLKVKLHGAPPNPALMLSFFQWTAMSHLSIDANGDDRHQYTALYTVSVYDTSAPSPRKGWILKCLKRESETICKSRKTREST